MEPQRDPNKPARLVSASAQYWSVELWTYLSVVKTNNDSPVILKSPRLHTHRWWYYTQPYGFGIEPGKPYIFWKAKFDTFLSGATIYKVKFNFVAVSIPLVDQKQNT